VIFGVRRHHGGRIAEAKPPALPGVGVGASVVDARGDHLDRAGRGHHLPGLVAAVAHHQTPTGLIALIAEPGDVVLDLGLPCRGQHPPRAVADDLIDQRRAARGGITRVVAAVVGARNYREHGSYLPDRRWRAGLA
jgi:hypothetical protein